MTDRARLQARIRAFLDTSLDGSPSEPFDALALDLHRWQAAHDPLRASLIEGPLSDASHIPGIPVGWFKDLPVGTVPPDTDGPVFRTSGTTGGGRGVHRLRDTDLYDHGARAWADRIAPDRPAPTVALLHDPALAPDSSLSHMVHHLGGPCRWFLRDGQVDLEGLVAALEALDAPVFLPATAFALADALDHPLPALPAGSVLMVTGGFKGRRTDLSPEDLIDAARARLLRDGGDLLLEYGMTELSSQLWCRPGEAYRPPPWLRVIALDPTTGAVLPPGAGPGQLRFVDLANLDSSVAVDTLDHGEVHADGSVTLHGRLPGARARGCSLTVEEAWARAAERP